MKTKSISNQFSTNILFSMIAQIISLLTSLVINLIVPKFIDGYQYAYWQTYVLYASYTGVLHFGLLDGIVLKFSEFDYDKLDKKKISAHFCVLLLLLFSLSAIGLIIALVFLSGINQIIYSFVSLSIMSKNLFMFFSYSFQITNRIRQYSQLVIGQRLVYGIFSAILVAFQVNAFFIYCAVDIISDCIGIIVSYKSNREIWRTNLVAVKENFSEIVDSFKAGSSLMVANFSNNFIIGSTKMVVQSFWSPLIFGQVSFGFSITNIFLSFVSAVSVVLFPSLKRMDLESLPILYQKLRPIISIVLFAILMVYFPSLFVLSIWLPNYKTSLLYAGILLPIIIYSIRGNLLINNYLKAYRLEKSLLWVNICCLGLELGLIFISVSFFRNLDFLLVWTVLITMLKGIWTEHIVSVVISKSFVRENIVEVILATIFIICTYFSPNIMGFCVYGIALALYIFSERKLVKTVVQRLRRKYE